MSLVFLNGFIPMLIGYVTLSLLNNRKSHGTFASNFWLAVILYLIAVLADHAFCKTQWSESIVYALGVSLGFLLSALIMRLK